MPTLILDGLPDQAELAGAGRAALDRYLAQRGRGVPKAAPPPIVRDAKPDTTSDDDESDVWAAREALKRAPERKPEPLLDAADLEDDDESDVWAAREALRAKGTR